MKQTTIPIKPDARVMVKCNADLSVEGNEESTLVVIVDQGDSLRMKEENGIYRIVSESDCRLILPSSAMVTIEKTSGDGQLKNLKKRVIIGKIDGDLKLNSIGGASVESVGGDCTIQVASGAIELARIGGNLTADGGQSILAGSVGGEIHISNYSGKLELNAGDKVSILVAEVNVPEIRARAGSDIELYLPENANCQLNLRSDGEVIKVHAAGQEVEIERREFSLPIGVDGAAVQLSAGDSIKVTDQEKPVWSESHHDWNDDHWQNFGFDISRKVKEGLKIASDSVEMAIKQAEKAGKVAGREVERVLHDLNEKGFKHDPHGKVVGFSMGEKQSLSSAPKTGPSDEERMLVLKMLQEKKITVEEAEKLLNALDR